MRLSETTGTLAIIGASATGRPRGVCLTGAVVAKGVARSFGLMKRSAKQRIAPLLSGSLGAHPPVQKRAVWPLGAIANLASHSCFAIGLISVHWKWP